jgi:hypothetical protein
VLLFVMVGSAFSRVFVLLLPHTLIPQAIAQQKVKSAGLTDTRAEAVQLTKFLQNYAANEVTEHYVVALVHLHDDNASPTTNCKGRRKNCRVPVRDW